MADSSRRKLAAILGALGASVFYIALATVIGPAQNRDFLNLYTGAMLARTGHFSDLYDFDLQAREQDRIAPAVRLHFPFVRPPFYAVLISPVSLLPFHTAYCVWIAFHAGLLLCIWAWSWRRFGPESIIYCSLFLPAALGIAHGQDCMVLAAIGVAGLEASERHNERWAGVLLAFTLAKFHLFLLVPFAITARRRWRMLTAYAVTAAVLGLGSIVLVGPAGVRGYIALLNRADLATLSPSPERMLGVRAVATNLGADWLWLEVCLAIAVAVVTLRTAWRSTEDWCWIGAAIAGSLLLSPHTYEYDAAVLLAFAVAAVHIAKTVWIRAAAAATLVPVPYLMTLAGSPWAAIPSLVLIVFLLALAYRADFSPRGTSAHRPRGAAYIEVGSRRTCRAALVRCARTSWRVPLGDTAHYGAVRV